MDEVVVSIKATTKSLEGSHRHLVASQSALHKTAYGQGEAPALGE